MTTCTLDYLHSTVHTYLAYSAVQYMKPGAWITKVHAAATILSAVVSSRDPVVPNRCAIAASIPAY